MNKSYVRLMLEEASRDLLQLLRDLETDPDFTDIELSIGLNEVYGPLNTAWNAREISESQAANHSEEEYYKWRQFPSDIHMS